MKSIFETLFSSLLEHSGLTPEQRITQAKIEAYSRYPFWSKIIAAMNVTFTKEIPTMAVDKAGNLYVNTKFVDTLSDAEVFGVLVHEAFHIATLTFFRLEGRHMKLWNWATDYVMNRDIIGMGLQLPKGGLIPDDKGIITVPVNGGVQIDISTMSAEALYDQLRVLFPDIDKAEKNPSKTPVLPKVGQVVRIRNSKQYGIIDKIDKTGKAGVSPLSKEEAKKITNTPAYKEQFGGAA